MIFRVEKVNLNTDYETDNKYTAGSGNNLLLLFAAVQYNAR